MTNIIEHLHMGDYTWFVWSAFGMTAFCLLMLFITVQRRLKKALKANKELEKSD